MRSSSTCCLRKHRKIRSELGISIPVPGSNDEFIETIFERLFSRDNTQLNLFAKPVQDAKETLFEQWDRAAEQEKVSRTRYAQHTIRTDEVAGELASVQRRDRSHGRRRALCPSCGYCTRRHRGW